MHHSCDAWEKFRLCFAESRLHYLPGYTVFSGKASNTVPKSKLLSSWLLAPCFFNIKFPDVLSLPHSSYCQNGSGKEVENRANFVTLKAAEWSVCITRMQDAPGCLLHSLEVSTGSDSQVADWQLPLVSVRDGADVSVGGLSHAWLPLISEDLVYLLIPCQYAVHYVM